MTEHSPELTADDIENLGKLFDLNATHSQQKLTDLTATWGLGGLERQLHELLGGLREADRPAVAVRLESALSAYVAQFGPDGIVGQSDTYRDHA